MTAPAISLPDLATWCRAMAGDPVNPPDDRDLWAALAQEIDQYLAPPQETSLFDQPTQEEPP